MIDEKRPNPLNPVQRHVDQIVDDLSKGRVTPKQRGEIGKARPGRGCAERHEERRKNIR
jgi:hypothetical protein